MARLSGFIWESKCKDEGGRMKALKTRMKDEGGRMKKSIGLQGASSLDFRQCNTTSRTNIAVQPI